MGKELDKDQDSFLSVSEFTEWYKRDLAEIEAAEKKKEKKKRKKKKKDVGSSSSGKPDVLAHRAALVSMYEKVEPDKVAKVDKFLRKYSGREDKLWAKLKKKYGDMAKPPTAAASAKTRRRRSSKKSESEG